MDFYFKLGLGLPAFISNLIITRIRPIRKCARARAHNNNTTPPYTASLFSIFVLVVVLKTPSGMATMMAGYGAYDIVHRLVFFPDDQVLPNDDPINLEIITFFSTSVLWSEQKFIHNSTTNYPL